MFLSRFNTGLSAPAAPGYAVKPKEGKPTRRGGPTSQPLVDPVDMPCLYARVGEPDQPPGPKGNGSEL